MCGMRGVGFEYSSLVDRQVSQETDASVVRIYERAVLERRGPGP